MEIYYGYYAFVEYYALVERIAEEHVMWCHLYKSESVQLGD